MDTSLNVPTALSVPLGRPKSIFFRESDAELTANLLRKLSRQLIQPWPMHLIVELREFTSSNSALLLLLKTNQSSFLHSPPRS